MPAAIAAVETRLFAPPLAETLYDAKHGAHDRFELITARIRLADGAEGLGYTYTGGTGGRAVAAMIAHDLAPSLIGVEPEPIETLQAALQERVHYVGRGGVASFAIAALDIALWDLRGARAGRTLAEMAGGAGRRVRAYAGGIDLAYDQPQLVASVERALARGVGGVKIKIGRPTLAEDAARVAAIRAVLGPDRALMVDANTIFDVETALAAAAAFQPYDLVWFEEPTAPEDLDGLRRVAEAGGVPIALGENLRTLAEFDAAIAQVAPAYLQPDASNCGGVTPWLEIAARGEAVGLSICSHGAHELHVGLLAGRPDPGWLEIHSFPIDAYAQTPLKIVDGWAEAPQSPGTGVAFAWPKLAPFEIAF